MPRSPMVGKAMPAAVADFSRAWISEAFPDRVRERCRLTIVVDAMAG